MTTNEMYQQLGISPEVLDFGQRVLDGLDKEMSRVDDIAEYNQAKVLSAMHKNRLNATHFNLSSGYGYDDEGRDNLERVYADVFHTEAALVRPQITCGTHALALALGANLLPGDELLSPVGAPYDTLEEVIGIRPSPGSLREYGVSYRQVDLLPDGSFDYDGIRAAIHEKTKLVTIQRSKGYATRPSFSVEEIGKLIAFCKNCKPDIICMVDNCYGELVERQEPTDVGADMVVGSLIKIWAAVWLPPAAMSAAGRISSTAAPTGSAHRASARRWAPIWGCSPASIRDCFWLPQWWPPL